MNKEENYTLIKNIIINHEIYQNIKDYSKERNKVATYYEIGKILNEAGGKYGDNIINEYSKRLVTEIGKKYNRRTLFRMKQFYKTFSSGKVSPVVTQLSWTHYIILLSLNEYDKINYYMEQVIIRKLSKRELENIIKNKEYERLPEDTKLKLTTNKETKINDFVKNPIIIKNTKNTEIISEKILQKLILEDINNFLEELGEGFCYIKNEYKIKLGDRYGYIDLLLYNIKFKCYVVVELKVTELKAEHTGQIQKYMNYIDNNIKTIEENKTIGIIICKQDNKYVIKYCSDNRIISRTYELVN